MENLSSIFDQFPTQKDCIKYLETLLWNNVPTCPYCSSNRATQLKSETRYHCNSCNTPFSVTVGTVFHNTKLPLQKWFLAITIVVKTKKKIPARTLSKEIQVTKDTAWRLSTLIRSEMRNSGKLLEKIADAHGSNA